MKKAILNGLAILIMVCLVQSRAAQKTNLAPDDPELYSSFFFFMENFGAWLDERAIAVPERKVILMQSAARYLKVDVSELPKVIEACREVTATLRAIGIQHHQYWVAQTQNKQKTDPVALQAFESKRQVAIQQAINQLHRSLSATNWKGLLTHINGTYRAGVWMHPRDASPQ